MASGGGLIVLYSTPDELRVAADAIEAGEQHSVEAQALDLEDEHVEVIFSPHSDGS